MIGKNKYGLYYYTEDVAHRDVCRTISKGLVYEENTVGFIVNNLDANSVVLHAGTFIGDFLPALSKSCKEVYAFEPVSYNYECALKTIELNELKNVKLYNNGLNDLKETKDIICKKNGQFIGGLSTFKPKGAHDETEPVECITLDSLSLERLDIIHLDVEGHELHVLQGAKDTINRCKPKYIIVERNSKLGQITEFLNKCDYTNVPNKEVNSDNNVVFTRV